MSERRHHRSSLPWSRDFWSQTALTNLTSGRPFGSRAAQPKRYTFKSQRERSTPFSSMAGVVGTSPSWAPPQQASQRSQDHLPTWDDSRTEMASMLRKLISKLPQHQQLMDGSRFGDPGPESARFSGTPPSPWMAHTAMIKLPARREEGAGLCVPATSRTPARYQALALSGRGAQHLFHSQVFLVHRYRHTLGSGCPGAWAWAPNIL